MTGTTPGSGDVAPELLPFPSRGTRLSELDTRLAGFYADESAALDEGRYKDWLDCLAPRFIYQLPVPLLREDPGLPRHSDTAMLFEATRNVLAMKLDRVVLRHAWSDRPSGVMRHFVGGVRVFAGSAEHTLRVDSNVLATFSRGRDELAQATAARQDVVVRDGDGYLLLRRRVLLDAEVADHVQLSIIF